MYTTRIIGDHRVCHNKRTQYSVTSIRELSGIEGLWKIIQRKLLNRTYFCNKLIPNNITYIG